MCTSRRLSCVLVVAVAAGLLSACGGGSGSPPPVDQPPQILGLQDQTVPQDTSTGPLSFEISDPDSAADRVTVTAQSSDTTIVSNDGGIVIDGSGASRTIEITPLTDAIGSTRITLRATDPGGLATERAFVLQVDGVFVSFRETMNEVFAAGEDDEPRSLTGITLTPDADDDPAAWDALLQ